MNRFCLYHLLSSYLITVHLGTYACISISALILLRFLKLINSQLYPPPQNKITYEFYLASWVFSPDNCIELAGSGTINQYGCTMFTAGCPKNPYFSDFIYNRKFWCVCLRDDWHKLGKNTFFGRENWVFRKNWIVGILCLILARSIISTAINYFNMRLIYVNMQHNFVNMTYDCVNVRDSMKVVCQHNYMYYAIMT